MRFRIADSTVSRLESVWGNDADTWNPERFTGEGPQGVGRGGSNVGVYANL